MDSSGAIRRRRQSSHQRHTHEIATLNRRRYAKRSEQIDAVQRSLLDESIDADIETITLEIEALQEKAPSAPKAQPRRVALPAAFPRREIRHEPEHTQCSCGCQLERIGEDVSEKLDYNPGLFQVERHIRGKWVCRQCERLIERRKSRDVAFVVHTLMQDANDVDTVCCMSIKQNVRSGSIHAVASKASHRVLGWTPSETASESERDDVGA